ncbi:TVP38/TMEM64 family membrane protein slr0305-like isoform X2 [Zingiber officinale]|uniref:TVP38/TMEM64 family membrane protein slr0305-like isoform X2 n=1 Tax=Zingiber officinale TaxID=94328 RepID=UPI001C4D1C23|nr:TVP38/TMEM64 family membrane protein slr0305-like isoform X2 [Zingiber officinale]
MAVSWFSAVRITLLVLLAVATAAAFFTLPVEKILREFLVWIKQNLGLWGPAMLAVAYIPLTILAVPAAVLSLGGGYLFGLPIGFLADSIGATLGSVAAFLLGRTLGRPYVIAKMNDYPDFQAVAVAIERSGFKPITLVLVYVGTTLDDLADVTHGWSEASTAHWGTMVAGLVISAILMVCVTREAKAALQKALAENLEAEDILIMSPSPWLPSLLQPSSDLRQPLMIKIET